MNVTIETQRCSWAQKRGKGREARNFALQACEHKLAINSLISTKRRYRAAASLQGHFICFPLNPADATLLPHSTMLDKGKKGIMKIAFQMLPAKKTTRLSFHVARAECG